MKLYFATTKRIAKKKLKHYWKKLNLGKDLKVGDIFTSCNSYNDIIQEITPIYRTHGLSTGVLISDFDIIGKYCSCSLRHCLTFPVWTKQQILDHWLKDYNRPEVIALWKSWNMVPSLEILNKLLSGKEVFDENGCLNDL